MAKIKVVAAVLTEDELTLYKPNGETVVLKQGDTRIRGIVDKIIPLINSQGFAEVDDSETSTYVDLEKKTGGLMKFFRIAKDKVKHLFATDEDRVEPVAAGTIPGSQPQPSVSAASATTATTSATAAAVMQSAQQKQAAKPVEERKAPKLGEGLMTHARPMSSDDSTLQEGETIVAVVGGKAVPGMENLKGQVEHAQRTGQYKGLQRLIERMAAMQEKRGHSVEDLLRFLEKGDLPIADDGSILAYKVLSTRSKQSLYPEAKGTFFDCHSGKIPQRVGSRLVVDEKLVDKNRRNECSNGLHIARRGYIGQFSGDVLTLCKIEPEDVITVPHGDPNKVRVCAYHIIAQISPEDHQKLRNNRPMTDSDATQVLLGKAIAGDHVGRLEEVRVTEPYGGGIQIKQLMPSDAVPLRSKAEVRGVEQPRAVALDDLKATGTDPKSVSAQAVAAKQAPATPAPNSLTPQTQSDRGKPGMKPINPDKPKGSSSVREQVAQEHYGRMTNGDLSIGDRQEEARRLLLHKQKAKVGWSKLGFDSDAVADEIKATLAMVEAPKKPTPAPSPKKTEPVKATPKPAPKPVAAKAVAEVSAPKISGRQTEANRLFILMTDSKSATEKRAAAQALKAFKSKAKVSWIALGLSGNVGDQIQKLLDQ